MAKLDETHDPARRSWVQSADGHPEFPIQNLPLGVFAASGGEPRVGVAIGKEILDLAAVNAAGLLKGEAARARAASGSTLNAFLALGAGPRQALRQRLSEMLTEGAPGSERLRSMLHRQDACTMLLPAAIGDYTDFYAGIHHATNTGRLFRPDNPLLPNYKYVPVAYHGRASSVRVSGVNFVRPNGQRKRPDEAEPSAGPSRNLDFELELGIWIGPGNAAGEAIPIGRAAEHIAGFCLLNDWSARDIQGWEYQPLGPFLAKNFATTISPWIVTPEAMAPFRVAQPGRPEGDPPPLPYLLDANDQREGALNLELEVLLSTPGLAAAGLQPETISRSHTRHLYWTVGQFVAHHTVGGCNLQPGDLFGSGTISSPGPEGLGSLLEMTRGGREPIRLASGETRRFLEDGDEVIMRARAVAEGRVTIGFGECRGQVLSVR
jgi:fumarylacetoacetase